MKVDIIRIGNSQGIRIPKPVLEQCGFSDQVEMTVEGDAVVLRACRRPRAGWDEAFAAMAAAGDDEPLLEEGAPSSWDEAEWRW